MASTPEGKVKKSVKNCLAEFGHKVNGFWPVPNGLGESHLDWVGCAKRPFGGGAFFCIETKAPGKKPTPRQIRRIEDVQLAGGRVFVIDGTNKTHTIDDLRKWLWITTGGNIEAERKAGKRQDEETD